MSELAVDPLSKDWRKVSHEKNITDVIQISEDVDLINESVLDVEDGNNNAMPRRNKKFYWSSRRQWAEQDSNTKTSIS